MQAFVIFLIAFAPASTFAQAINSLVCSPYFTNPSTDVFQSNVKITVKGSEPGTAYYVTYNAIPSTAPSGTDIIQYVEGSKTPPASMVSKGSITVTVAGDPYSKNITNLPSYKSYYTYAVLKNSAGSIGEVEYKKVHLMAAKETNYFYTEYRPADYASSTKQYALLIFLHGNDESGSTISSLDKVMATGLPREIKNGVDFPEFVIVSPQSPTNFNQGGWNVGYLNTFLQSVKAAHGSRLDVDRIYMTGLSMGGFGTWNFALAYPDTLAAIVPSSGAPANPADPCSLVGLPIWAFHDDPDNISAAPSSSTKNLYNTIKACADGAGLPVKVNMTLRTYKDSPDCTTTGMHAIWNMAYSKSKTPYSDITCTSTNDGRVMNQYYNSVPLGSTIYSWLLLHSNTTAGPVVDAGPDKVLSYPDNSVTLYGSATDDGTISSYLWTKVSGPQQVTMTNANTKTLSLSNMEAGIYVFELKATDNSGLSGTDRVQVTVNGPATTKTIKINFRASNHTAAPGGWNDFTTGMGSTITNLQYTDGGSTSYSMSITSAFSGSNASGSTSTTGVYPPEVMQTAWFVNSPVVASMTINGLDNTKKYTLKLFGSRTDATTSDRNTEYVVGSTVVTVNASNNSTMTADFTALSPTNGSISFSVRDAAGGYTYGYLNAMEIVESADVVDTKFLKVNFRASNAVVPPSDWNDFTTGGGSTLSNLKYSDGATTDYAIEIVDPFTGSNTSGSTSTTGVYPASVMQTAWFVTSPAVLTMRISGLDNSKFYTLKFFGSRLDGTTSDRNTVYTVGTQTVTLNASNNSTLTADIVDISPTTGSIEFTVSDAAGGYQYGYLNALEIVESSGSGSLTMMAQESDTQMMAQESESVTMESDAEPSNPFTIHPMPYSNQMTVTFEQEISGRVAITVTDNVGRVHFHIDDYEVYEGSVVAIDLSGASIPKGMGVIKVRSDRGYSKTVQIYKE